MRLIQVNIGEIMPSKNYGDFKIIKDLGRINKKTYNSSRIYKYWKYTKLLCES